MGHRSPKKEAEATAGKGDGDVRIRMESKPQVVYYVCLDLANGFLFTIATVHL